MKEKNNKNRIILVIVVLILCIIVSLLAVSVNVVKNINNNDSVISTSELADIINELGSKYISVSESAEKGYNKDIYVEFKCDLYEKGISQERVYAVLIESIILNQKTNIRLIDESKNIIIRINYNVKENTYFYSINGEENYFEKNNSLNSLENYTEFENTELRINSEHLNRIIDLNWKYEQDVFGTKESIYNNYNIFFDEGIEVKLINGNVYNIIFNSKYEDNVLNNLNTGLDKKEIISVLGKPTFESGDIIGYKNEDIYVFFYNGDISIYRNQEYQYEEFSQYLEKYFNSEINVKEFINELTYLWPDYSQYDYDSKHVYLNYAKQGILINLTSENQEFIVYGNCKNIKPFLENIKNGKMQAKLDKDAMFLEECNRISYIEQIGIKVPGEDDYIGSSKNFQENILTNKVEFYSINEEYPSCTLTESISSYFWLEDNIFIYSIAKKGIYYFDLNNRESYELLLGDDNFEFNNFEDGILTYDDENTVEIGSD